MTQPKFQPSIGGAWTLEETFIKELFGGLPRPLLGVRGQPKPNHDQTGEDVEEVVKIKKIKSITQFFSKKVTFF